MRLSFIKIESFRHGIVFSSLFNFVAKGLVFLQGLVIAYYFGAQSNTDVYFYCFSTITLAAVFINTLDSSVIVPEAMRLAESEGNRSAMRFLNFFIFLYIIGGVVATALFYISPVNIILFTSQFDAAKLREAREILLLSIPLFALIIVTNLLANILASYKYFTMPMMVSAINGIFALVSLIFLHNQFGISSLLIGTITAYVLNLCFLFYVMRKQLSWTFSFQWVRLSTKTRWNILMAQIGNFTSAFSNYAPFYLLSSFGPGVLTALTYGQKTAEIPQQLINLQFSAVAGIKFNELHARGDFASMDSVFYRSAGFLFAVLFPMTSFMFVYSGEIISILFKHGVFTDEDVETSGVFLKYFALVLPFYVTNNLIARLFMAAQKIMQSFWYQVTFNGVLTLAYFLIVKYIGYTGLPIALAAMHCINFFASYFLTRWFFPYIDYAKVIRSFFVIGFLNAIPAIALYLFRSNIPITNTLISVLTGGSVFVVVLALLYYVTGIYKLALRS